MNQYDFTRPVRDPAMFFGRRALRQEILDGVRQGASFAIIGGTRLGKTSLLFQVRQALLEQLKAPQNAVIGPVFLSTHELPPLSQSIIYRRIIEEFRVTLGIPGSDDEWRRGVALFDQSLPEDRAFGAFQQALELVLLREFDRRIVIMIDEVDELRRYDWSHFFFNNLRHLISQTIAGERIAIVIAGTLAIRSLYQVAGSPFLNVIHGTKSLELLSRAETEELVGRPIGHQLDASVVSSIFLETGGHPFLTQYLMKHLCSQHSGNLSAVSEEHVQSIVEKYFDERTDFQNWVTDFTDTERQAYRRIATGIQGATRAELVRTLNDPKRVDDAIRMLIHIGVVREERPNNNRYLVGGHMFRRWFFERHGDTPTGAVERGGTTEPPRQPRGPERELVRVIKVFVASPGDVVEERKAVEPVVAEINRTLGDQLGCRLEVVMWETDAYAAASPLGAQPIIDSQIDVTSMDVVIGIFWTRFGTDTGFGLSGSAHEIQRALEASMRRGKPHVMVYFCDRPARIASVNDADQQKKVLELREQLGKRALMFPYEQVQQFKDLVRQHLGAYLQKHVEAPGGYGQGTGRGV
ncbi:MAG TPA: AAA-like domain-containing protein [Vicinamibacterales bacterium]|jgi:hypothetical protein|nr:AAA-like domain-containing protein [Vicinamibacterales bacterium]